jgi:hypothetical protein
MSRLNTAEAASAASQKFSGLGFVSGAEITIIMTRPPKDPAKAKDFKAEKKLIGRFTITPLDTEGQPNGEEVRVVEFGCGKSSLLPNKNGALYNICPAQSTGRDDMEPVPQGTEVGVTGNCLDVFEDAENNVFGTGLYSSTPMYIFLESCRDAGLSEAFREAGQFDELEGAVLEFDSKEIPMNDGTKWTAQIVTSIRSAPGVPDFVQPNSAPKPTPKPGLKPGAAVAKKVAVPAGVAKKVAAPAPAAKKVAAPVKQVAVEEVQEEQPDGGGELNNFQTLMAAALTAGKLSENQVLDIATIKKVATQTMMTGKTIAPANRMAVTKEINALSADAEAMIAQLGQVATETLGFMDNGDGSVTVLALI